MFMIQRLNNSNATYSTQLQIINNTVYAIVCALPTKLNTSSEAKITTNNQTVVPVKSAPIFLSIIETKKTTPQQTSKFAKGFVKS